MSSKRKRLILAATALAGLTVGGAAMGGASGAGPSRQANPPADLPRGSEPVQLDPANFTTKIDNPYWPMRVGSRWVYRETNRRGRVQRVQITVTPRTKVVAGIRARVLRDVVTERGRLVENTSDWVAQDRDGNIWYLGEDTAEYENGRVSTREGSWEAGVDGAQAGILVPAKPRPGLEYRQEYRKGEAEDAARVLSLDEQVQTPLRRFTGVLMTKDFTPLQPRALEYKFYARGVGLVLAVSLSSGFSREELVRFVRGGG